jgi:hypothetical protein
MPASRNTATNVATPHAAVPAEPQERTPEEIGRIVDEVRTYVNQSVRESGLRHVELADRLFRDTYGDDARSALALQASASAVYAGLLKSAGDSLLVDRSMLSRLVRVGALDRLLPDARWQNLGWASRVELLPLVKADGDLALFKQGIQQAQRSGVGVRALRAWVKEQLAAAAGEEGPVRKLSVRASMRAFGTLSVLGKARSRRLFVAEVEKMEIGPRKQFLAALDDMLATLGALRNGLSD